MKSASVGERVTTVAIYALFTALVLVLVYPFIHVLSISFSDRASALRPGFHFFPRTFSLEAYVQVFQARNLWIGFGNTAFRMAVGSALTLIVTICAAYPLSKSYFPIRKALTLVILFTMIFEGGIIPTYMLLRSLDMIDTRAVYVLLSAANAFHVLVLVSFLKTIPKELEEAARIDGAGEYRTLLKIMLPLTMPVLVTLTLWNFVFHLNYFTDNLLYVTDRSKFVLQLVMREILIESRQDSFTDISQLAEPPTPESLKMAAIVVSVLPMLLTYPFLLRYFEKGTMIGSVKG